MLKAFFDGRAARSKASFRRLGWAVLNIVGLRHAKRLPALSDLVGDKPKPQRQSWQEILTIARMWTAPFKAASAAEKSGRVPAKRGKE